MTRSNHSVQPHVGLVVGLCLALGACNGAGPSGTSLEDSMPPRSGDMLALAPSGGTMPTAAVVALPDEAGTVASVRGHSYLDGFRQDVLFKASPVRGVENGITILAQTSRQSTLDEKVPLFKPSEAAIRAEIGRAFPHLSMQVVERPASNAYGAYGLAIGRAGGTIHCIYMWQWIDAGSTGRDVDFTGPASVQVRLCKSDATFDALAAMMDHLSLRRDAGSQGLAVVDPPHEAVEPRKHVAARRMHRAHRVSVASAEPRPTGFAETPVSAPAVSQPLASDLPAQAYLGPRSAGAALPATMSAKPLR